MKEKKVTLRRGIETILEFSKDNKDIKQKAKFMAKWVHKFINERKRK